MEDERKKVRQLLYGNHLSQVWLIDQLALRQVYTDKSEMSSILAGARDGAKADKVLSVSLEILSNYEKFLQNSFE